MKILLFKLNFTVVFLYAIKTFENKEKCTKIKFTFNFEFLEKLNKKFGQGLHPQSVNSRNK